MPQPTHRHMALAAEAVTGGPSLERDVVQRVAQAIAEAETRGRADAGHEVARTVGAALDRAPMVR